MAPGQLFAQFMKMGSKLCQIGNEMRMLTTATAEALKTFRDALSLRTCSRGTLQTIEEYLGIGRQARAEVVEV